MSRHVSDMDKRQVPKVVTPSLCNIYHVNINGYKSKAESLKHLIVEQNVDILLLVETNVYSKSGGKIEGFQVFPAVRKRTAVKD